MMIISRMNLFLPVKLETTRFTIVPAVPISKSGAPPAGYFWIHHLAGWSLLPPIPSVPRAAWL